MSASYFSVGMNHRATFDLFARELPPHRSFLVANGIEASLEILENFSFTKEDLAYLTSLKIFEDAFIEMLSDFRFTGEVWGFQEGELVFPGEPIIRVTAPLIEAQIVETILLNQIGFATAVTSKAARIKIACTDRIFIEMGARRAQGADAALIASRAAIMAGATSTSNLLAGKRFGVPVAGTMAHSYISAFHSEAAAFKAFARQFPDRASFLIDTFDTLEGARVAALVADDLGSENIKVSSVRIDSGDLTNLSRMVRVILDQMGHPEIGILVSGDLDEWAIEALNGDAAPIDGFGVGTRLSTSQDAPDLGVVYKLAEDESGPKFKLSPGKRTLPGRKQVFRLIEDDLLVGDRLALASDAPIEGEIPMLHLVMKDGRRINPSFDLSGAVARCQASLRRLGPELLDLRAAPAYPVHIDESLLS